MNKELLSIFLISIQWYLNLLNSKMIFRIFDFLLLHTVVAISLHKKESVRFSESSNELRILARHYEPFMYQQDNKQFYDGIEFRLIGTVASELKMKVEYVESLLDEEKSTR